MKKSFVYLWTDYYRMKSDSLNSPAFRQLLALLRCSLFGQPYAPVSAGTSAPVDWAKVLECAGANGLTAVSYEAVKALPLELRPDFGTMLLWDLSAQGVRQSFDSRKAVKEHLRDLFASADIRMLILKGESLADCYPVREIRESGDLDIMLLDGYDRGNALVEAAGIAVDYSHPKHSRFVYEGLEVENHVVKPLREYYVSESRMKADLEHSCRRQDGCWELQPESHARFLLSHMIGHLNWNEHINLKMLLDLALLLRKYPSVLQDWSKSGSALEESGLVPFARLALSSIDLLFGTTYAKGDSGVPALPEKKVRSFLRVCMLGECSEALRPFIRMRYVPMSFGEKCADALLQFKILLSARLRRVPGESRKQA